MANLTIDSTKVRLVQVYEQATHPASVAITAGQAIRRDTNGKWAIANATSAGNAGNRQAIAIRSVAANESLTGVYDGLLDVGEALAALAFDAKVFLSDTAGTLADAAGTVSVLLGTVAPGWAASAADRLLRFKA